MSIDALGRRLFLQGAGTLAGSLIVRAGLPTVIAVSQAACSARDEASAFRILSNDEAREISAMAARIFPTTDTPGATEAGAVHFIDQSLGSIFADLADKFRNEMADFQAGVAGRYPGAERFSDLSDADQDEYLASVEDSSFFAGIRFLTLAGVFAMSAYGGNRDNVGWKLVGMDGPPHAWTHPFGEYDAEYTEGSQDGH